MKSSPMLLLLASLVVGSVAEQRAGNAVTPVQKVVELLGGMLDKGKADKHSEQVQFAAYKQFCDDTSTEKQRAIAENTEQIEVLKADIEKASADAARLTREVAGHEEDVATWTGDSKAAASVRDIERADYDATHRDYSESISALERAIVVLKQQNFDRKQASFAQLSGLQALQASGLVPPDAKGAIEAFLAQDPADGAAAAPPQAYGYEFRSRGVIEMLEQLLDKFTAERTALEKEEANGQHAFELLVQDLKAQIQVASQDRDEKTGLKASRLQAKADAEGDLADATAAREADQKYLADLTATCEQKSSEFEARQQLRAEELAAIEKAVEIISGAAVAGSAEKYLPSMLQARGSALLHLRADKQGQVQALLSQFLRARASELNSRMLSDLAERVSEDPFAKVKKLIQDLIVRLMEEANEEAEHKGWCDTELATNEQTRKEKTQATETLHAEIDQLEASIAKLTEDIATLTAAVADLDAAMAQATALRQQEKAENEQTVKDAAEAQAAVAQAITVLKEFYAKAGEATALLQQQPPEIFTLPYKGMQAQNGGVIAMLEVVESDFARLEAETKASEASAQGQYDTFMRDSKVDRAQKSTDIEHKSAKKQDETQALTTKRTDLDGTQKELDAALAYFDKLKPACVDAGVTYEDRVARRQEEIQSLQEALRILNGEATA